MRALFVRTRKPKDRKEGGIVPDSFFRHFGDDVASVSRDWRGEFHATTFAEIGQKKKDSQRKQLAWKTAASPKRRAGYIWVFHCPGAFGFAFKGWWTYLVWIGGESDKHNARDIERLAMSLFPMPDLFPDSQKWARWFAKRHQRGQHCGKPQGKAFVWIDFDESGRIAKVTLPESFD